MLIRAHLGLMIVLLGVTAQAQHRVKKVSNYRRFFSAPSRLSRFTFENDLLQSASESKRSLFPDHINKIIDNDLNSEQVTSASGNYEVVRAADYAEPETGAAGEYGGAAAGDAYVGQASGYGGGAAVVPNGVPAYPSTGGAVVQAYAVGVGAGSAYGGNGGCSGGCAPAYQTGTIAAYPVQTAYQAAPVVYEAVPYQSAPISLSPLLVPQPQGVPVALAPVPAPAAGSSSKSFSLGLDKLEGLSLDKLNLDKFSGLADKLNLDLGSLADKFAGLETLKSMPSIKLPGGSGSSKFNGLSGLLDKFDGLGSLSLPSISLHVPEGPAAKELIQQLISISEKLLPAIRLSPKAPVIASSPMVLPPYPAPGAYAGPIPVPLPAPVPIPAPAPIPAPVPIPSPEAESSKSGLSLPKLNLSEKFSSLGLSLGSLSDLFSKFDIGKKGSQAAPVGTPVPVAVPVPVQVPSRIVSAYPLQNAGYSGHVVIEDFPYGRPQYGRYDEGGEASLGCAELDSAVPVPVPAPAVPVPQGGGPAY